MAAEIQLLDVVALKDALPEHNLQAEQVGTAVEELTPDVYEVEFSDDEGRAYAFATLKAQALLKLHHRPIPAE